ncbi:MAG: AmmeMemoRadiSam system protein B [Candidatus Delongbacteria bacterium]
MKIRHAAVEGSFYPSDIKQLNDMLSEFDKNINIEPGERPKAILVPHAGLLYSGQTAAFAYKLAQAHDYRSAVIFAPSHRVAFYGMSYAEYDRYESFGIEFDVNTELGEFLKKKNRLISIDKVHEQEHSTEVQLPFIYKYLKNASITVFVYSEISYREVSYVINDVLDEDRDLVIISSDLSHFLPYDECVKTDENIISGLQKLDIDMISKGDACGMTGIKAIALSSKERNLKPEILDYKNSGDISGDRSGVVGYLSAVFT